MPFNDGLSLGSVGLVDLLVSLFPIAAIAELSETLCLILLLPSPIYVARILRPRASFLTFHVETQVSTHKHTHTSQ